jgi:hypothetical protein
MLPDARLESIEAIVKSMEAIVHLVHLDGRTLKAVKDTREPHNQIVGLAGGCHAVTLFAASSAKR